jgi:hypothetical protein
MGCTPAGKLNMQKSEGKKGKKITEEVHWSLTKQGSEGWLVGVQHSPAVL